MHNLEIVNSNESFRGVNEHPPNLLLLKTGALPDMLFYLRIKVSSLGVLHDYTKGARDLIDETVLIANHVWMVN